MGNVNQIAFHWNFKLGSIVFFKTDMESTKWMIVRIILNLNGGVSYCVANSFHGEKEVFEAELSHRPYNSNLGV